MSLMADLFEVILDSCNLTLQLEDLSPFLSNTKIVKFDLNVCIMTTETQDDSVDNKSDLQFAICYFPYGRCAVGCVVKSHHINACGV